MKYNNDIDKNKMYINILCTSETLYTAHLTQFLKISDVQI
jgi:hypothetical protein